MTQFDDRGTAVELAVANPFISAGTIVLERDTGAAKRGPGFWNDLEYWDPTGTKFNYLSGFGPTLCASTGEYWSTPGSRGTAAGVDGTLYAHPVWVPKTVRLDRIGAEVTSAVSATTLTLGIYQDNGSGNPGTLLLDAGTIDGNSATVQEKTIYQRLVGPALYHFAALVAGGTPSYRSVAGTARNGRHASAASAITSAAQVYGRTQASVVGTALPATAATTTPGLTPAIGVRLA